MDKLFVVRYCWLIPLLPLIGAALAGLLGARWLRGKSHWPIWLGAGASAVLSVMLLIGAIGVWHADAGKEKEIIAKPATAPATASAAATTTAVASTAPAVVAEASKHAATHGLWASPHVTRWFDWISAGDPAQHGSREYFHVHAGAWIDPLTIVMLCVVTCIGFLITIFSAGYMKGEAGYFRFFAYLGLFIFSMTVLVMADNFVLLYLGWEGVGVCSYLLIGYYYNKPSAREAAKKAFIVNRIGDFGFSLGIMLIFLAFSTVSFFGDGVHVQTSVFKMALHPTPAQATAMQVIPFLLMLGAFGKSAQFPLYVWLPDAMEGPTPVSALIHAATMVTAGVYMIARCGALFASNEAASLTVACVGAFTAIFAASIAMRQFDLKKVWAYSTVSQLGFMFSAMGVLAPVAGIFHLVTHAFFKALLFLAAGIVMHAMAGELDLRKMSGLKRKLPWTNLFMLAGCLALAGVPFIGAGFFSKDEIISGAFDRGYWLIGVVLLVTALMTAYYTFRLYFRVFQGPEVIPAPPAAEHGSHDAQDAEEAHEQTADQPQHDAHGDDHAHHNPEPWVMKLPLIILAVGAIFAGYLNWPERSHNLGAFLRESPSFNVPSLVSEESAEVSNFTPLMGISGIVALAGIYLAYLLHLKNRAAGEKLPRRFPALNRAIENRYWVDELYQAAIVEPLRQLGRIFFAIDRFVIDGAVWLVGFVPQSGGLALKLTTQRGYLQGYAAAMLLGIAVILLIIFL